MATSGGILTTNFDYSKLFIGANRFKQFNFINPTSGTLVIPKGTLMGLIFGSNNITPCKSASVDGSQVPFAILQNDYTVLAFQPALMSVCVWGDVAREGVIFDGADTFTTLANLETALDSPPDSPPGTRTLNIGTFESVLLWRGLYLTPTTENTRVDNP